MHSTHRCLPGARYTGLCGARLRYHPFLAARPLCSLTWAVGILVKPDERVEIALPKFSSRQMANADRDSSHKQLLLYLFIDCLSEAPSVVFVRSIDRVSGQDVTLLSGEHQGQPPRECSFAGRIHRCGPCAKLQKFHWTDLVPAGQSDTGANLVIAWEEAVGRMADSSSRAVQSQSL